MMTQEELLDNLTEEASLTQVQEYIDKVVQMRGFSEQPVQETMLLLLEETGELAKAIRKSATNCQGDGYLDNVLVNVEAAIAFV